MRLITLGRRFNHAPDRQATMMRLDIILPGIREHTKDARRLHATAPMALRIRPGFSGGGEVG